MPPVPSRARGARGALGRAHGAWLAHPRLSLSLKAAVAAALAWVAVRPLGGFVEEYQYYAPFGAVVAVSSTLVSSVRSTVLSAAAIGIGAALAVGARQLPGSDVAALALAVAVGTALAGWSRLGAMGSWVPVSAVFTLLIGNDDPLHYVLGYWGLTVAGAAVGVLVNAAFPPLPLTPTRLALRQLRLELAGQLDEVAEGLELTELPSVEEWEQRRHTLAPHVERVRSLAQEASDARRANWRARRWQGEADRLYHLARALDHLSGFIEQVVNIVIERESAEVREVALGPEMRPTAAAALRAMARLLTTVDDPEGFADELEETRRAIDDLRVATRRAWAEDGGDRFTAAAIVTVLERATAALADEAASGQSASPA